MNVELIHDIVWAIFPDETVYISLGALVGVSIAAIGYVAWWRVETKHDR